MRDITLMVLLAISVCLTPRPAGAEESMNISPEELMTRIDAGEEMVILDVRSVSEYRAGHVPGAIHVPFWSTLWRADDLPLSGDGPVVIYCAHGPRAWVARSGLGLNGNPRVRFLKGHMRGWKKAGLPSNTGDTP